MSDQKQHNIVTTMVCNHPKFLYKNFKQKDITKMLRQRRKARKSKNAKH